MNKTAPNRPEGHTPIANAWCIGQLPDHTACSTILIRGTDTAAIDKLREELTAGANAPTHVERARVLNTDTPLTAFIGYWTDPESQRRWHQSAHALVQPGVLVETALIPAQRCETIYSTPETMPGMRNLRPVELTDVHEYWGASRDRIADSAVSDLSSEPGDPLPGNLCLLRGGQVWQHCPEAERAMFFADVLPKLEAAIHFLASDAYSGCISCRLMRDQSMDGEDLESSSFIAWFRDFNSLEVWTSTHPTHLGVFGA